MSSSAAKKTSIPFADAHFHSASSDGLLSPSECARQIFALGIRAAVLTDHDTIHGWAEFQEEANSLGLKTIIGAEISCRWKGRGIHLLAYGINAENEHFTRFLLQQRALRLERGKQIQHAINQRLGCTLDSTLLNRPGVVCRSHIARQLIELSLAESMNQAFAKIPELQDDESQVPWLPLRSVLSIVTKAGGLPVLAHPGTTMTYANLVHLKTHGLRGLEAAHPSHDARTERQLRVWARNLGLIATGGSDTHGVVGADCVSMETSFGCNGMNQASWLQLEELIRSCASTSAAARND
ncbi:MAG: PHP domain-containing protein [Sumerlaeia bacterium]